MDGDGSPSLREGAVKRFRAGLADVIVVSTAADTGAIAATFVARHLRSQVSKHGTASVILATGNSQIPFMDRLRMERDVPWSAVAVFHMDEYVGMPADHPASFRRYLRTRLVDVVHPRVFHPLEADASDLEAEMARYSDALRADPPDLCVLGFGENGHLAFNDPPADFEARAPIRIVELSTASRRQQVGEGHFSTLEEVPAYAITLTIPTLLAAPTILAVVPERRKASAVVAALRGPVSSDIPASILQKRAGVTIVLDSDSASGLG